MTFRLAAPYIEGIPGMDEKFQQDGMLREAAIRDIKLDPDTIRFTITTSASGSKVHTLEAETL